ncbi:MAG: hypothetical protein IJO71_04180 [Microbacterium sp.]|jgi:membrane protein implicated in regulation of membrane protease activity|uniref:hypothetical protein n=1 Tax=Microbacterium sp. TaxID=51671 RepID=UPI0025FE15D7|nr:hypothetical protein [Microbacterium sp.]MBQ9916385.1 hypothetical protein [Microbacterium sp.]
MFADNRSLTLGLMLGILGLGIGVGLVVASFLVGVGTTMGAALSSSGTIAIVVFLILTTVLTSAVRRQRQVGH